MENQKNIALLIDAENISYKYIDTIFDELKEYGNVTIRKLYGDLSKEHTKPWIEPVQKYAIIPVQQYQNSVGKNSSDMALVIDAMDILYNNPVDIFCIASSDSDFTRLASRIRQEGKMVFGMGESKASQPLVNAFDKFQYLNVIDIDDSDTQVILDNEITPIEEIKNEIITLLELEDGFVENVGVIKEKLQKKYPDFDSRNYGCSKFSKFIELFSEEIEVFIQKDKRTKAAKLKNSKTRETIEAFVIDTIRNSKKKRLNIGEVNKKVMEKYPEFNPKDYGYKQVKLFFTNIKGIKIKDTNDLVVE
ncbi:MAG: NYN domain-containing protein [Clostridia bacterium]|nr:NYN domain-containing protein [Clostridia bacterium]